MSGISPEVLHGAPHTGELALPVAFPHPHHGPSTSFVCLQGSQPPVVLLVADINSAPSPRLPSSRLFTVRAGASSFAVRGTSRARRFRPRRARPPPGSRDDRRSSLWCRHALPRPAWLRPAPPPMCRYAPHAIPRNSLLVVVRCAGPDPIHRRNLETDPNGVPFPIIYHSRALHLFIYPAALCARRHPG